MTLATWFQTASPGDRMTYATCASVATHPTRDVKEARSLYDLGLIDLVQRRVTGGYEYIAVKRRRIAVIAYEHSFAFAMERV